MAHWLYFSFTNANGQSYVTGNTSVTGFPIYNYDKELLLTADNPCQSIGVIGYSTDTVWGTHERGIKIGSFETVYGYFKDAVAYPKAAYTQESPVKLFRVETETEVDKYATRYEDAQIKGRYLVREVSSFLKNGLIVPVRYLHKGVIRDGIGNYNTSSFTYLSKYTPTGSYDNDTYQSRANTTRSYISSSAAMMPMAVTRKEAYSNRLLLDTIEVGDVLDFGPEPQNVPDIIKTWLDNSCENITDSEEPVVFNLTSPGGIQLFTANTFSRWDMQIIPKLEEISVTPMETAQTINVGTGFAGIKTVQVAAAPIQTPELQEKELEITENGTQEVFADTGKDGLSKVTITTSVILPAYDEESFTLTSKEG